VQIEGAPGLIPDGATITLDGDAGLVIIHEDVEGELAATLAAELA
jgi:pyruvate,water dikinase